MNEEKSVLDLKTVYEAGIAASPIRQADGINHVVVPPGCSLTRLPDMRCRPNRKVGEATVYKVNDFVSMVKRESDPMKSVVFCDFTATGTGVATCIVDCHGANPDWCDYRINLGIVQTPEYKSWSAIFGTPMMQVAFAEFLEERSVDINSPSGADVLEMALTMQSKTRVDFLSGVRLQDGTHELEYRETAETKAGKTGTLDIPSRITLFLPIFVGGNAVLIECVMRYKIADGKLTFVVKPLSLATVIRQTFDALIDSISGGTGLPVINGRYTKGNDLV